MGNGGGIGVGASSLSLLSGLLVGGGGGGTVVGVADPPPPLAARFRDEQRLQRRRRRRRRWRGGMNRQRAARPGPAVHEPRSAGGGAPRAVEEARVVSGPRAHPLAHGWDHGGFAPGLGEGPEGVQGLQGPLREGARFTAVEGSIKPAAALEGDCLSHVVRCHHHHRPLGEGAILWEGTFVNASNYHPCPSSSSLTIRLFSFLLYSILITDSLNS